MDRRFSTFLAVAEAGSITSAAKRLNITQPTLTKRLQLLETTFGCKLVERQARGVRLTREGERLLPFAKRMRDAFLQGTEAIEAVRSGHLKSLRVGAGPLFQLLYLGDVFTRLRAEYPDTTLRLLADFNSRIIPRLRDGRLDLTLGTRVAETEADGLVFEAMMTIEQGVIVRQGHPITKLARVTPQSINHLPWVVFSSTTEIESLVTAYFALHGGEPPRIVLQTTSLSLAFRMVADSDAIMALPIQLQPVLAAQGLVALRTEPPIGVQPAGAYVRPSSLDFPVIARTIDLVAQAVRVSGHTTP